MSAAVSRPTSWGKGKGRKKAIGYAQGKCEIKLPKWRRRRRRRRGSKTKRCEALVWINARNQHNVMETIFMTTNWAGEVQGLGEMASSRSTICYRKCPPMVSAATPTTALDSRPNVSPKTDKLAFFPFHPKRPMRPTKYLPWRPQPSRTASHTKAMAKIVELWRGRASQVDLSWVIFAADLIL